MKEGEIRAKLGEAIALQSKIYERINAGKQPVSDIDGVPLTSENIEKRIGDLAEQIHPILHQGMENPVFLSILDGALPFAGKLQQAMSARGMAYQYATIKVSSYVGTTSGALSIQSSPKVSLGQRNVFILDDVIESGKTIRAVKQLLVQQLGALRVETICLVDKAQRRDCPEESNPILSGFVVSPEAFIIGMGMDYEHVLRDLDGIWAVDPATLPCAAELEILSSIKVLNTKLQECLMKKKLGIPSPKAAEDSASASPSAFFTHSKPVAGSSNVFNLSLAERKAIEEEMAASADGGDIADDEADFFQQTLDENSGDESLYRSHSG